ncbi:hypothetical protein O1R50_01320 [Glycomyces luteolus]|uniref:Uncharacterized protein n=1 Tax=Glycomyces luteolus TaxID=2670330 RepID=A0A9X3P7M1_9ACTN|nr:hypothetical protein [Glycomyces luteolus]MDA1358245.1 hypothetical protein [Glycomyces luteolus]
MTDPARYRDPRGAAGHRVDGDADVIGYRRCYTRDPFGNRLEFLTPFED